ncbi:MAG TPA: hydrogenase 4 membrane subunit [Pyrodictium sp.]|nr:hydrogenase 4 membrane subunit [Pyrodictium sp.]
MVASTTSMMLLLALGMLVTALMISDERRLTRAVKIYALQSLLLATIFVALALSGDYYLLAWAVSAVITKTVLVPWILLRQIKRTNAIEEKPVLGSTLTWLLSVAAIVFGFAVGWSFGRPHMIVLVGVSVSLFLIGLIQMTVRRSLIKQLLGFCHFENSSHLTLAILAPGLPETVEIGIATDAIVLILVGSFVAYLIWRSYNTLDYTKLRLLREG